MQPAFVTVSVGDRFEDNLTLDCYKVILTKISFDSWKHEVEVTVDMIRIPDGKYLFDVTVDSLFFLNFTKFQF